MLFFFVGNFVTQVHQNGDIFAILVKCSDVINCGNVASNPSTFTCCYLSPLLAPPAPKPKPNLWNSDILYACFNSNSNISPKPNLWNSDMLYSGYISNISQHLTISQESQIYGTWVSYDADSIFNILLYLAKAKFMELRCIIR